MTTEPDKSNQLSNIGEQTFKSINTLIIFEVW